MPILGAIGAVTRFGAAKHLVGYAGLGAGVHDRGTRHRDQGSTNQGRRDVRFVLVAAARVAVQPHPYWQRAFARLAKRIGEPKAVVAIARPLLMVVWHVLMARRADRRADAEQVAVKLMVWAWKLTDEQRGGLRSRQVIRAHRIQVGRGAELTHSTRGGTRRPLATIEEVLALRPEVRGPSETTWVSAERSSPVPAVTAYPPSPGQDERAIGRGQAARRAPFEDGPARP
jgi:transposase IS116/IS110/IS902 family protein